MSNAGMIEDIPAGTLKPSERFLGPREKFKIGLFIIISKLFVYNRIARNDFRVMN
jgi:hypothetical protein